MTREELNKIEVRMNEIRVELEQDGKPVRRTTVKRRRESADGALRGAGMVVGAADAEYVCAPLAAVLDLLERMRDNGLR